MNWWRKLFGSQRSGRKSVVPQPQFTQKNSYLLLLLPPGVGGLETVKAAAKQVGLPFNAIKVMNGRTDNITRGIAEALLAKIDHEEGTSYLSRPFIIGQGTVSGQAFAYIQTSPKVV